MAYTSADRLEAIQRDEGSEMQNAIAFADNDVVVVAWSFDKPLPTCLGFAVYRIDKKGKETPLPSMAVFPGFKPKKGQTTEDFPIQKLYWKDPYARLVAEETGSRKFRYKIVPLEGKPGALTPMSISYAISNEVELTPHLSDCLSAYFNRGIISTQHVSAAFGGNAPSKGKLLERVTDPADQLRADLAGDMIGALTDFIAEAKSKKAELFCALYELSDQELIGALAGLKSRLHIILSNPSPNDEQSASGITDGNAASRAALKAAGAEVVDRLLPNGRIGHNKFAVLVKQGKPAAVLFGSTNWTSTGLCTQTNNTIIWRDETLAKRYLEYWKKLAKDTADADGVAKDLQGEPLRSWDAISKTHKLGTGTTTSWFSPNTPGLRSTSNKTNEKRPPDMDDVANLMANAKDAILFLAFNPGRPSIVEWAAEAQKLNKALFVRGCVTARTTAEGFVYDLKGTSPPAHQKGDPPGPQDPRVIAAAALSTVVPAGWKKEILNAGFAVTHDKIVVIDPFSDNCVVVTGSHNLGYKASFNNDENLVIVKGNRALAGAYTTHVLDIYDHFSWRWLVGRSKGNFDATLKTKPDEWQSRYYNADGSIKNAQVRFWLSALPSGS
jgi:phosphatidylserine/phosphatidylglycerophosphate/cardiolipin synthase-like enzyme